MKFGSAPKNGDGEGRAALRRRRGDKAPRPNLLHNRSSSRGTLINPCPISSPAMSFVVRAVCRIGRILTSERACSMAFGLAPRARHSRTGGGLLSVREVPSEFVRWMKSDPPRASVS